MKRISSAARRIHRTAVIVCVLVAASLSLINLNAEERAKKVRVGWYESSFNITDEFGRRSGYAYEYQQKIAAYSGWEYEYISGSWSELLEKLINGEIDLLSDVSYTPEREEYLLFPTLPMGTEEYYLFIAPGNQEITPEDTACLNGKKVGVNKGSIQAGLFRDWVERNQLDVEVEERYSTEDESLKSLQHGNLDAYVTVDSFTNPERAVPVYKIGSSDFFFAVNKEREDLLADLNRAMSRIQDEDRYYNQQLFEKYFKRTGANAFLLAEETAWLESHGTIRIGYQDNYLAFCAKDPATGELTGALKDYLETASDCMVNSHLDFEAVPYDTLDSALKALQNGDVDAVFPSNLTSYDGEKLGVIMTAPLVRTDMYAVVRQSDQRAFSHKDHVIVAVNQGNANYETFLLNNYPNWQKVYYDNTAECLEAVSKGMADCVLISNFRYNNIARLCEKYHLTTLATGISMDYSFAIGIGNTQLYSIMSKAASLIPDSTVNAALSYYVTEDAKLTLGDFISDHLGAVMIGTGLVVLVILVLMTRSMRAERIAKDLISATEKDDLTGLFNRKFFFQYANRIYREHPDVPMDAIVLNIEQFHAVNAVKGRNFGDRVLFVLGSAIREIAEENGGIAGRFEADRFDIYCRHMDDYEAVYDRLQKKLDELAPNTSIRLRIGVMPWQSGLEPEQMFDHARTACNMARGHYQQHLVIYDDTVGEREIYDQRLLSDLRRALDDYEFEVYYQPKYNIQTDPPKITSVEALVRWNHPELGMIPPGDFIPLFEKNGRISEVDKYVWEQAAKQVMEWREKYDVTIPVSVNLSRVDVFDPSLVKTLDSLLKRYSLHHEDLKLEVTESAYTENAEHVIQVVADLRKRGYQVEMDDFGTGYSSLNMLSDMPVDVLKMDRLFVRNIEHEERDIQLVALILGIAKNLKIPVVAEGVETEKQMKLLQDLGCTMVQGYYFSRPLHPSEFEAKFIRTMKDEAQSANEKG